MCYGICNKPLLKLRSINSKIKVTKSLLISDVILDGQFELIPGCTITTCYYCAEVLYDNSGIAYDDKGNQIDNS